MDDVCIEEDEAVKEMRDIYETVEYRMTQGSYSLEEAIKKVFSAENVPQNVRRSERIQMQLIQKESYLAAQRLTYKTTLNETTTSQKKLRKSSKKKQKSFKNGAPSSLFGLTSQSSSKKHYVNKVPERIEGIIFRNGKEYVVVKWKRKKYVELVAVDNLTDSSRKLFVSFLHSHLRMLSGNDENASQEEDCVSVVRGNFLYHESGEQHGPIVRGTSACLETEEHIPVLRENLVYQDRERQTCENREDPVSQAAEWRINSNSAVTNTNRIDVPSPHLQKINILSFKRQQKLVLQENRILDNYNESSVDIKLSIP